MKNKLIVLLLAIVLFFVSGCDLEVKHQEIKLNYTENDLEEISLYISQFDLRLDLSNDDDLKELLLSLKLYKDNSTVTYETHPNYILSFGNYELSVGFNQDIYYIDNNTEYEAYTLNNEFNYLDTLYNKEELNFNSYVDVEIIKVYNSKNDSTQVTEKEKFLNNLKQVKYIKLNNQEIFELGTVKYQIQLDEDLINVYNEYIVINDNLYVIIDGDLSFLNDIKFSSSSGWLPWI